MAEISGMKITIPVGYDTIKTMQGTLYVAASPIGNLKDMSARAIETMQAADLILCEDTRTSQTLLNAHSIDTPTTSLHQHNEASRCGELLKRLTSGETLVLICDAGTPTIRDAGKGLVQQALDHKVAVRPLPGASAVSAALSCCGFDADRFVFEGFLPSKAEARQKCLKQLSHDGRTLVFFETPHRLIESLQDMKSILGSERPLCLAKELTKMHETVLQGTADELLAWLAQDVARSKGEFVIIAAPTKAEPSPSIQLDVDTLLDALESHLSPSQAASVVAKLTKLPKKEIY